MKDKRQLIPIFGLMLMAVIASYLIVQLNAQSTVSADFTNAATAEVRDGQGQVILRGQFVPVDEDDDDIERKATLAPTSGDADASGEAEVEYAKDSPMVQEVEFSIRNVQPGATYTFVIDGKDVATATADGRGRAEVEVDVRAGAGGAH
jgi:hypothetical protein